MESVTLRTFGRQIQKRMPVYKITIFDKNKDPHELVAYGESNLSKEYNGMMSDATVAHYAKVFKVRTQKINNPAPNTSYKVDLILGECNPLFSPKIKDVKDNTLNTIVEDSESVSEGDNDFRMRQSSNQESPIASGGTHSSHSNESNLARIKWKKEMK